MATVPHVHISGINGVLTFLVIVVAFGSLHLLALSYPDSQLSQGWMALGF